MYNEIIEPHDELKDKGEKHMAEENKSVLPQRLLSLDVFRGLTIAGMILVNNPGSWGYVYEPLEHAPWHGWTPTDFVFPFFLFIVGVAIPFSFNRFYEKGGNDKTLIKKIVVRSLILFGLGLFLAFFPKCVIPKFDLSHIRIFGVLQRIALCFLFTSLIVMKVKSWKGQITVAYLLILFYWLAIDLIPVPGYSAGMLTKEVSLPGFIDTVLLGPHSLTPTYDPEGIFSTIPAISTTLIGVLVGNWLRSSRTPIDKTVGLFVIGNFLLLAGVVMSIWMPINKYLWTSSYVVFMGGMAMVFLAICYYLIDVKGYKKWAFPFTVFGMNAITAFFGNGFTVRLMNLWKIKEPDGTEILSLGYVYKHLFVPIAGNMNGSLLYAICMVLFWFGILYVLYRKKIFVKI